MRLLTGVEVVNGGSEQHGLSDLPFWNRELNEGCRLTGIAGSDNHSQYGVTGSDALIVG